MVQAFGQVVGQICNCAEAENVQADDELQLRPVGPRAPHAGKCTEFHKVQMNEVHYGAQRRSDQSPAAGQQDARHHDFQKIEIGDVTVDSAGPIDDPCNHEQIDNDLGVSLPSVVCIDLEKGEPNDGERK